MIMEEVVLCGASCYSKKFYINEMFANIPKDVRDELKIMCVLYTEDVGGTIQLVYDENCDLIFKTDHNEDDLLFDEIGSELKIRQYQREKKDLLEKLQNFYKIGHEGGLF